MFALANPFSDRPLLTYALEGRRFVRLYVFWPNQRTSKRFSVIFLGSTIESFRHVVGLE
ncbi:hypothetical protein AG1IA_08346 [Rhizoctonia solani AG-1 IA]|uniref:Uncharacterized protein n=1 Tax=Thanatephorus cucumeris (strain AG1-IA) TaxID=983506 RepID=L8WMP8_THACA|nr:hypothetical protein AG1IA_08346 [Rhizoctonia solani AG-1 IA]